MSDSENTDIAPKGGFKPPQAFIQVIYKYLLYITEITIYTDSLIFLL